MNTEQKDGVMVTGGTNVVPWCEQHHPPDLEGMCYEPQGPCDDFRLVLIQKLFRVGPAPHHITSLNVGSHLQTLFFMCICGIRDASAVQFHSFWRVFEEEGRW